MARSGDALMMLLRNQATKSRGLLSAGSIHHVMQSFSAKNWPKKIASLNTSRDVLEPLKQALLASRGATDFSQIAARTRRGFSTLGDGFWLPILGTTKRRKPPFFWHHLDPQFEWLEVALK